MSGVFTGKPCRSCHGTRRYVSDSKCTACASVRRSKYRRQRKASDPEYRRASNAKYRGAHRTLEQDRERKRKLYATSLVFRANSLARHRCREASLIQRTPAWVDLATIKKIYQSTPAGYHVDHEIPLRGRLVSGLHIHTNLRVIPALANLSKGAKYEIT